MKSMKALTALLCALFLLVSLAVPAFADGPANVIKGGGSSGSGKGPSAQDILATEGGDKIQLPKGSSYFSAYATMYINAEKGHSVTVHSRPMEVPNEKALPYAFHGARVCVLAQEGGLSCLLYYDKDNIRRAGWVYTDYLATSYPGRTLRIRNGSAGITPWLVGDPEVSWSRDFFVGSKQKYTLLNETVKGCSRFVLDYQVIARNGAGTEEVLGPRTLYVNAGDGWVEVGSFDYDKLGPVHVEVQLAAPIDLMAVATVASCAKPDTFQFRQSLLDVYQAD